MARLLAFLHTSAVHIHTCTTLLAELAPDIPTRHVVEESFLSEACAASEVTQALRQRVEETLLAVSEQAAVVMCTCSSIGSVVEDLDGRTSAKMMRIDRPMTEKAVELGSHIIVAATLTSTLQPTRELIYSVARQAQREVEVIDLLCDAAWRLFQLGNHEAYVREIAEQVQRMAVHGDVIVLAQASMARATELCPDLTLPVLTSPRSGLEAAVAAYRLLESSGSTNIA